MPFWASHSYRGAAIAKSTNQIHLAMIIFHQVILPCWLSSGGSRADRSVSAHLFSIFCSIAAVILAWKWFQIIYPPRSALILALALALNWSWGRVGGSIQSEPLFMLWELLAVLMIIHAGRRDSAAAGVALGIVLAICILIRHVGVCFAAVAIVDLGLRDGGGLYCRQV